MPVYAKKVQSTHPVFQGRETVIMSSEVTSRIPIPDNITLCNGCNENVSEGYLVYLGKREVKANQPYDYYCKDCLASSFPKAIMM